MGKVVACLSLKGGVGKTTIAVNAAAVLSGLQKRVVVLDLDPQRTAAMWAGLSKPNPRALRGWHQFGQSVIPVDMAGDTSGAALKRALEAHQGADVVIVDTPPSVEAPAIFAALASDLVLIPCGPSIADVWAGRASLTMIRKVRKQRGGVLPLVSFVPSRMQATAMADDCRQALADFGEHVAPGITLRVAVAEAIPSGKTVGDFTKSQEAAWREFQALAFDILGRLKA